MANLDKLSDILYNIDAGNGGTRDSDSYEQEQSELHTGMASSLFDDNATSDVLPRAFKLIASLISENALLKRTVEEQQVFIFNGLASRLGGKIGQETNQRLHDMVAEPCAPIMSAECRDIVDAVLATSLEKLALVEAQAEAVKREERQANVRLEYTNRKVAVMEGKANTLTMQIKSMNNQVQNVMKDHGNLFQAGLTQNNLTNSFFISPSPGQYLPQTPATMTPSAPPTFQFGALRFAPGHLRFPLNTATSAPPQDLASPPTLGMSTAPRGPPAAITNASRPMLLAHRPRPQLEVQADPRPYNPTLTPCSLTHQRPEPAYNFDCASGSSCHDKKCGPVHPRQREFYNDHLDSLPARLSKKRGN
ncbi:hypothetical protein EJ02DRAFT_460093 [Clathrospora elynae]|uniref:Uncharacterized protein n=1 Tax=Clathrospora elynae TaxID=706981 RepID=A0A6A5S828_9PLEO|nr:hypothetical protein EJ02DRAFT_460093 [Clathrospora elynae]